MMGDFFEDLGKKITETAEVLGKKTEEVVEVQKIRNQIRALERCNEKDIRNLGSLLYGSFKNNETVDGKYEELCREILAREEIIEDCKDVIAEIKGTSICKNCQYTVDDTMFYCPNCGSKIEREVHETECESDLAEESIFEEEAAPEDTVPEDTSEKSGE